MAWFTMPFADFHQLNLDWLISKYKKLEDDEATIQASLEGAEAAKEDAETAATDAANSATAAAASATNAGESATDAAETAESISDSLNQIAVNTSRINNLVANAGDTDNNAELLDIRTGYTGTVYNTAGEATRGQSSAAHSGILEVLNSTVETNNKLHTDTLVDITKLVDFHNAYYSSSLAAPTLIYSSSQLSSSVYEIPVGTVLNIRVNTGYRVYVKWFDDAGAQHGGAGWFTSDTELTTTYPRLAFNITKNPYSTTDTMVPNEAGNIQAIYKISTPTPWTSYVKYKNNISNTGPAIIGTQGTVLLPAGSYTMSGIFNTSASYMTVNMYGPSSNIYTKQITPRDSLQIFHVVVNDDIERIMFTGGSGQTVSVTGFRMDEYIWNCLEYHSANDWIPMPFIAPDTGVNLTLDEYIEEQANNTRWKGKKAIFNGDSITAGIYTTETGGKTGYVRNTVQALLFGDVKNYAIGGTRLARVSGESNALVDRLTDMDTDADLVFIMANTNDYASQVPLGDPSSRDVTTYNGALNTTLDYLLEHYPTKTVIMSTMLSRKENTDGQGNPLVIKIEQYAQAVRDRTHEHNIILYDAFYDSGLNLKTTPLDGSGVSDDGLHPNSKGAELLAYRIIGFLKNM